MTSERKCAGGTLPDGYTAGAKVRQAGASQGCVDVVSTMKQWKMSADTIPCAGWGMNVAESQFLCCCTVLLQRRWDAISV